MNDNQKCSNCKFYDRQDENQFKGICRRRTPFNETFEREWCGEFESIVPEKEKDERINAAIEIINKQRSIAIGMANATHRKETINALTVDKWLIRIQDALGHGNNMDGIA